MKFEIKMLKAPIFRFPGYGPFEVRGENWLKVTQIQQAGKIGRNKTDLTSLNSRKCLEIFMR